MKQETKETKMKTVKQITGNKTMKNATRHFYAQIDFTVRKTNIGHGFVNSKEAVAFESKAERDSYIASRSFDLSCKAITRAEAVKMSWDLDGTGDRSVVLHGSDDLLILVPYKY